MDTVTEKLSIKAKTQHLVKVLDILENSVAPVILSKIIFIPETQIIISKIKAQIEIFKEQDDAKPEQTKKPEQPKEPEPTKE